MTERRFVPVHLLTDAGNGVFQHFRDYWWITDAEGRLLFVETVPGTGLHPPGVSPQCNAAEDVARFIQRRSYPELEVRQIPSIFVRAGFEGLLHLPRETVA